jgi:hypothetical protein
LTGAILFLEIFGDLVFNDSPAIMPEFIVVVDDAFQGYAFTVKGVAYLTICIGCPSPPASI